MIEIEYETKIEKPEMMEQILSMMGFVPVSIYERYRTTYIVNIEKTNVVLDLDKLPFGNYLEVEGNNIKIMEKVIQLLSLNSKEHVESSYDGIYQKIERNKGDYPNSHIRFKLS